MATAPLLADLETAAKHGLLLFPVVPRGKKPIDRGWQKQATNDLYKLHELASRTRNCNWGALTGNRSNLFVLDVDGDEGKRSLDGLCDQHGPLPETLTVTTSRGIHLYFRPSPSLALRNSAGNLGAGLDTRGEGGLVVVPPSIHETGARYSFSDPNRPIAPAPHWLLRQPRASQSSRDQNRLGSHIAEGRIPKGRRNNTLFNHGSSIRGGGGTKREILEQLKIVNSDRCDTPLQSDELECIAESASRYAPNDGPFLERALKQARQNYGPFESYFDELAGVAVQLQKMRRGEPILLPVKLLGKLLGCSHEYISRPRRRAVKEGLICEVREYDRFLHRATAFTVPGV